MVLVYITLLVRAVTQADDARKSNKHRSLCIIYFAVAHKKSFALDGSRYEGHSVNNFFEGQGKMVWEDGGFYEGEVCLQLLCFAVLLQPSF